MRVFVPSLKRRSGAADGRKEQWEEQHGLRQRKCKRRAQVEHIYASKCGI